MNSPGDQNRRDTSRSPARADSSPEDAAAAGTGREKTEFQHGAPTDLFAPSGLPAVPGYVVTREIARGGMGAVYAAHDPIFGREVAVKIMHPGQDVRRFVVEAKVTARLPHPGVPPVHALGALADGRPFLAMKFITGHTLTKELPRADLPRLLGIFEQLCQTVGFAHAHGIVHRDLKPSNVMIGAFGEVLVVDWGLAKVLGKREPGGESTPATVRPAAGAPPSSWLTQVGQVKGTPEYMAPEQARGEEVDARADVFALGGVLASILAGAPPFVGGTALDTVLMAAQAELTACLARLDACAADPELIALAKRCLAAGPADRYANGEEVAAAVVDYRAGVEKRLRRAERDRAAAEATAVEAVNTRREAEARVAEQRKRRRVQRVLLGVVSLVVCGAVAAAWWQDRREARRAAAAQREEAERDAERRFKAEQDRQGVRANRALAEELRKQYKFAAADAALARGLELAKTGAPDQLAELTRARGDLAFVAQLDDIRFRKWAWIIAPGGKGEFNIRAAPSAYRRAFAARGLDLEALTPATAAARIAASPVRAELVAALDDWAIHETDPVLLDRLLEVTRRAEPGAWLDRLRDPAVRTDRAALAKLAADADPAATPPAALSTLATLLSRNGLDPSPVLSAARARHPTNFELAFVLGLWHTTTGSKSSQQIGAYEAARALRPETVAVWNNLGSALLNGGDRAGAVAAFREAVRLDPKFAAAYMNLGNALSGGDDTDGALAAFREAVRVDPKYAGAHVNLGNVLHTRGDLTGAIAAHREAIQLDPKLVAAHVNLASILAETGDLSAALPVAREAVRLDPRFAPARFNLGNVLRLRGDIAGAVAEYREAVRLDPKFVSAHVNLGLTLLGTGDPDGAVVALREAVKYSPPSAGLQTDLGNALDHKGDVDEAIAAFREALRLDPKFAPAYSNLGSSLLTKGDVDGAVGAHREAVKLAPRVAAVHTNLGVALYAKEDMAGAIAAYREAIRLDPALVPAYCNLGNALAAKGDADGAIAAYREALRLNRTYAPAHARLGRLYFTQQKYPEALASARAAVASAPKLAEGHALLGELLLRDGELHGARAALTEAARLDKRWASSLAKLPSANAAPPPREVKP